MSELSSSLLGVNELTLAALRNGRAPDMLGKPQNKSDFAARLEELLAEEEELGVSTTATETECCDSSVAGIEAVQRTSLEQLYIDAMLADLETSEESNTITEETAGDDLLAVATEETAETGATSSILEDNTSLSAQEVVLATGNANQDLIDKINSAATIDERLEYAVELRDKIIDALKDAGYTAYDIGKPDKVSIDGELYDVIRASRKMGRDAGVQFMEVGVSTESDSISEAIWEAGEDYQDTLSLASSASDLSSRQSLAMDFRDQVLANLTAQGYDAQAGSSADKITVNGETYDIIRSLNSLDSSAMFQVMQA